MLFPDTMEREGLDSVIDRVQLSSSVVQRLLLLLLLLVSVMSQVHFLEIGGACLALSQLDPALVATRLSFGGDSKRSDGPL